ncbi:MAG: DUF2800 domain-containing protein [Phenylobacterium sp.]|uniref:PD-(D/E)XK nuclease family protein n=1 Tax=Phenylobacterium sp. TaxID=1871053 RepID=UPI00121EE97F|nr:PD-(D/E)XK nuclease family protein [Phenylobacterium sp.]TAL29061.1 MAG: DUF2800 domain-containing protein [Phenylobacterium sp.]
MIRPSRLPAAEHCGLAAGHESNSTNAAALLGDAFHAAVASHYNPTNKEFRAEHDIAMGRVSPAERDEIAEMLGRLTAQWEPPPGAEFEIPIAIDRAGISVETGDARLLTEGTADCGWSDGDAAAVVDWKSGARAEWNVPIPRENLQLAAYGLGLADRWSKPKMKLGLYLAREGKWLWDTLHLDSGEGTALWERTRAAALRDPTEAVIGPHCNECYVRLKCPAHLLPVIDIGERENVMAPMTLGEPDGLVETQKLLRLINACKAMEDLADAGRDWLKAYVRKNGSIVVDGQQWGPIEVKGRESTSVKALKEAGLYDRACAVGAVRMSPPTQQHRWTKARP